VAEDLYVLDGGAAREVTAAVRDLRDRPPTAGRRPRRAPVVRSGTTISQAYARIYNTTLQTITTGTPTAVTFGNEDTDPLGWHDPVSNTSRITTGPGTFLIGGGVRWTGNATGRRKLWISQGSGLAAWYTSDLPAGAADWDQFVCGMVWSGSAGEYWELRVLQDSGGNLDLVAGGTPGHSAFWAMKVPAS
jgi:hypothetical protein